MLTAIVWVPTTSLTSETALFLFFPSPASLYPPPPKQKSQESNRTSPISLMCIEIQAYSYMSPYGPLVKQMKEFFGHAKSWRRGVSWHQVQITDCRHITISRQSKIFLDFFFMSTIFFICIFVAILHRRSKNWILKYSLKRPNFQNNSDVYACNKVTNTSTSQSCYYTVIKHHLQEQKESIINNTVETKRMTAKLFVPHQKIVMLVVLKTFTVLKTLHVNVADINATFISGHAQILSASHLLRKANVTFIVNCYKLKCHFHSIF